MLDSIESAIEDIKNGKLIIVVDDEDRENEGGFYYRCRECNTRSNQLYEYAWAGIDLCIFNRGTLQRAEASAHGCRQYFASRNRLYRKY